METKISLMKKKKIILEKESLMSLQENQMKSLIGADDMSDDSGAACGNTIETNIIEDSCCRRSCNS